MPIFIQFETQVPDENEVEKVINAGVEQTLLQESSEREQEVGLSVLVGDDDLIRSYNAEYRGVDKPTDVLSFEVGEEDPDDKSFYLGDIIISYPTAAVQAAIAGHTVLQEVQLLVAHGVLHLLGYDHQEENDQLLMWAAKQKILDALDNPAQPTM